MQIKHLFLPTIISLMLGMICRCGSYSKLAYKKIENNAKVTNIKNCRIANNVIYTTGDGKINLWTPSDQKQISLTLGPNSNYHYLQCSKYGSKDHIDNSYIGIIDQFGTFTLWEEVSKFFQLSLNKIQFSPTRVQCRITDISIGSYNLALGCRNEKQIYIYNLKQMQREPDIISTKQNWRYLKLDNLQNLGLITEMNETLYFQYYQYNKIYSKYQFNQVVETNLLYNQNCSIDYEISVDQQQVLTKYLISGTSKAGYIKYHNNQSLSSYYSTPNQKNSLLRLCDSFKTYSNQNLIIKIDNEQDDYIVQVDYNISNYTSTTDTGVLLHAQFYIVSSYNNQYFIDCYYSSNTILQFVIWTCFLCYCFWIRVCAQTNCNVCSGFGACLELIYKLFCWCPTKSSLQDIQQSLQY